MQQIQQSGLLICRGAVSPVLAGCLRCQAAKQPHHSDDRPPAPPDISMLSPELQKQWHVDLNRHLGAVKVGPYSGTQAVWQCDKCPAGQPHIWTTTVKSRTHGTQCPFCNGNRVCLHNSLATIAPATARYWNYSKNDKPPEEVLAGCRYRAEWKCPACKHEWQARVDSRTSKWLLMSGCPACSTRTPKKSHPTCAEAMPPEMAEWDYERNDTEGIFSHKVTLGSCKQVHWICSRCPRGQPHRWTAMPAKRIGKGTGCPVCDGKQACVCNSLASLDPSIAAEFDVIKNGFLPSDVSAQSHKKVWWTTAERGSWRQTVNSRTSYRLHPRTPQVWLRWTCHCFSWRSWADVDSDMHNQTDYLLQTGHFCNQAHDSSFRLFNQTLESLFNQAYLQ